MTSSGSPFAVNVMLKASNLSNVVWSFGRSWQMLDQQWWACAGTVAIVWPGL